jgi:hypothetical protein
MYAWPYICTHKCTHTQSYMHIHTYSYTQADTYTHTRTHTHTYTHIHTYIHREERKGTSPQYRKSERRMSHTHTHTHIHTHTPPRSIGDLSVGCPTKHERSSLESVPIAPTATAASTNSTATAAPSNHLWTGRRPCTSTLWNKNALSFRNSLSLMKRSIEM